MPDPFVPVPEDVIPVMLSLAGLKPGELLVDMGSGDGRILFAAAKDFGALAIGVEVNRELVRETREVARGLGLGGKVKVLNKKFVEVSLRKADVVAMYLSSHAMGSLKGKLRRELKEGAKVVTFDFEIFGWKPALTRAVVPRGWKTSHLVYLYDRSSTRSRRASAHPPKAVSA